MQKQTNLQVTSEVKVLMVIGSGLILLASGLLFLFVTIIKACAAVLTPSGGR
jgi:hypothetical protein